jgi:DNA polymerase-3 subunit beta
MRFTANLSAIRAARTHAAEKDVRYYLNGVCFDFRAGRIYATDGHRLFICNGYKADHDSVIVPADTIDAALKQFTGEYGRGKRNGDAVVVMTLDGDAVTIETPCGMVSGKLLSGKFPDVGYVVPRDAGPIALSGFNARYLADASDALAIYRNIPAKRNFGVSIHSRGNESAVITDGRDGALVIVMPMRTDAAGTPQNALQWFHDTPEASGMASAAA